MLRQAGGDRRSAHEQRHSETIAFLAAAAAAANDPDIELNDAFAVFDTRRHRPGDADDYPDFRRRLHRHLSDVLVYWNYHRSPERDAERAELLWLELYEAQNIRDRQRRERPAGSASCQVRSVGCRKFFWGSLPEMTLPTKLWNVAAILFP